MLEPIPTNDAWCRDHGAIIVDDDAGGQIALDFRYNAWGGKYPPYDLDDAVPRHMAAALGLPCVPVDMVWKADLSTSTALALVLTTEQCLLNRRSAIRRPGARTSRRRLDV